MNNRPPAHCIPYGPVSSTGDTITMRIDLTDSVGYL
jgi:hypothetical protein